MKMGRSKNWVLGLATSSAIAAMFVGITACDPVPGRVLTPEEKVADMMWIYSQFGENYAPLEYKQKRNNFNYEPLKLQYIEQAKNTKTNNEFYDLMFRFVSEFKDAHTSAALTNSSLPDHAQVAFLGFSGVRNEDYLIVKTLLPTIAKTSNYPIKLDDKIIAINGKTLKQVVDSEMVKFRNLGFDESNYTYHFNKIFTRSSTSNGLPTETEAVLTVKRGTKELKITLPWVIKDLVTFQEEQEKAKKPAVAGPAQPDEEKSKRNNGNFLMLTDDLKSEIMKFSFLGFDGRTQLPIDLNNRLTQRLGGKLNSLFKMTDTFRMPDFVSEWEAVTDATPTQSKEPLDKLADLRKVLPDAIYIAGSKTYPSYVAPVDVLDKDGKKTKEKMLVGYIYVDSFSPDTGATDDVMKEFKNTLASFKNLGVRDIVIDTINNGGGSLELGMKMAQALTPEKITQPMMQFRLSDTWIDEFRTASRDSADEATKEYARRIYEDLKSARMTGARLSQPYNAEVLYRYQIEPNADIEAPFRVKLLVNEMCASMCDMFAGIIQDNKLGQIVGTRSMGAGGNVVNHTQAPNSHIEVRQTESLMVRLAKEGAAEDTMINGVKYTYMENNGVTPDVAIPVVNSAKDKYGPVLDKAVELIVKKTE